MGRPLIGLLDGNTRAMPTKGLLRTLIVAEIGIGIISIVVSLFTESMLPEPLRAFLEAESEAEITAREMVMIAAAIPLIILLLVSSIGLFFFWRPARILYLLTVVLGLAMTPLLGPYVDSGWATTFEEIAVIISGVILALVYYSPLRDLYEKPKIAV
ncbi:MAG: hypothetical protein AMXMBFR13_02070 [Phycisphaerae bacterium]